MLKQVIEGWTHNPGAPKGWDPIRDGECGTLPIRLVQLSREQFACESSWQPTPAELEMLNAGGNVILRIVGWQVPVALYVEPLKEGG